MSIRFNLNGDVLLTDPKRTEEFLDERHNNGSDEELVCTQGMEVHSNRLVIFSTEVDLDTAMTILQGALKLQSDDQPYFTIWSENAHDLNPSVIFVLRDYYTEKSLEELASYYAEREIG